MTARRPRGGFTLVEILLALSILGVILTLLLSAFTGAGRAREILTGQGRKTRQILTTLDRIGVELEGAVAATGLETTAFACRTDSFTGRSAATLIFTAFVLPDAPGGRPGTDLVKLKYFPRLSPDGRSVELYREEAPLPLVENRIATAETRLAGDLKEYRFEFYDGSTWVKEWPASGKTVVLPERVAVVLVDADDRAHRKVVALRLAGAEGSLLFSGRRSTP